MAESSSAGVPAANMDVDAASGSAPAAAAAPTSADRAGKDSHKEDKKGARRSSRSRSRSRDGDKRRRRSSSRDRPRRRDEDSDRRDRRRSSSRDRHYDAERDRRRDDDRDRDRRSSRRSPSRDRDGRRYDGDRDRHRSRSRRSPSRDRDRERERSTSVRSGPASVMDLLHRVVGVAPGSVAAGGIPTMSRFGPPSAVPTVPAYQPYGYPGAGAVAIPQAAPAAVPAAGGDPAASAIAGLQAAAAAAAALAARTGGGAVPQVALPSADPLVGAASGFVAAAGADEGGAAGAALAANPAVQAAIAALRGGVASAGGAAGAAAAAAVNKVLRELYVGGLPQNVQLSANMLKDFLNQVLVSAGLTKGPGNPITSARMNDGGAFAFIEFRSIEETDMAVALGTSIPLLGSNLKIGRPKGYQTAQAAGQLPMLLAQAGVTTPGAGGVGAGAVPGMMGVGGMMSGMMMPGMMGVGGMMPSVVGAGSTGAIGLGATAAPASAAAAGTAGGAASVSASASALSDVLLIFNVPALFGATELGTIFEPFGAIKRLQMLPAGAAPTAEGTAAALLEFSGADAAAQVDVVVDKMQGLDLGVGKLSLARAPAGLVAQHFGGGAASAAPGAAAGAAADASSSSSASPTPFLELHNVIVSADLASSSSSEVDEIKEDVAEECAKFGRVMSVVIPPLTAAARAVGQEGASAPVYVVADGAASAAAIASALRGRRFEGRPVSCNFVDESVVARARGGADAAAAGGAAGGAGAPAASGPVPGRDYEDEEDEGREGGVTGVYGGVAIPPPAPAAEAEGDAAVTGAYPGAGAAPGAPEDGLTLPPPGASDLD